MRRANIEITTSIALYYLYQATNGISRMISRDKVLEYDTAINNILDETLGTVYYNFNTYEIPIYFYSQDEKGNEYLIIKTDVDIKRFIHTTLGILPTNFLVASQHNDALEVIGLELKDGKFIKKQENNSTNYDSKKLVNTNNKK